jgi:hypothetical protein
MPSKTNHNILGKALPNAPTVALNYKHNQSNWGLEAFYEGYRLVFSADFNQTRLKKERWAKILKFFKIGPNKNPGNIIGSLDLYDLFSQSAKRAWNNAYELSKKRGQAVSVEDVFLALLKEPSVKNILDRLKVDSQQAEIFITNYLRLTSPLDGEALKKIPFEAFALSARLRNHKIGSLMLLGGLLRAVPRDNILQAIFTNIGLTSAKLELFSVWLLDLDYDFPPQSTSAQLLFCLRQAQGLEEHFGYFFDFPAITAAMNLSLGQTLKDLQHVKALQLLVKAGLLAQSKGTKIISENLVIQAAGR